VLFDKKGVLLQHRMHEIGSLKSVVL